MSHEDTLRQAKLKVTAPRLAILEMFHNTDEKHLSAEDIYKIFLDNEEEIGLATVYRVLTQFEVAGILTRHYFEGSHAIFELSNQKHHDHLVCTECGQVEEFFDETIERRQDEVAANKGFKITHHALYLYGLCSKCQK